MIGQIPVFNIIVLAVVSINFGIILENCIRRTVTTAVKNAFNKFKD